MSRRVRDIMGMPITIEVAGAGDWSAAVEAAFAEFELFDGVFSTFLPESEVSRIRRGELALEAAGPLVTQAAALCRSYEAATAGYFSAWHDGRFDPTGLVKGWAIDRAASILDRHGCRAFFVDAGGDVLTRGRRRPGGPWRVGIRHPVERDRVVRVIDAEDLAVATSGTYEKGSHIRDPHTGRAVEELVSFTVVGPDILTADIHATACFAMGWAGLDFLSGVPGYQGLAIGRDLRGGWTAGFEELCAAA